jgi:hypothetical protein
MKIIGTSSNGGSQENVFYSNTNIGKGRGGKTSFRGRHEARMVDIINIKVKFMEVDEEILEEEEVEEVVKVVVEIIKLNNQIMTQIATNTENLGTWQRTIIKGNMMHEMESCNKGNMHQLVIKVMSNCL